MYNVHISSLSGHNIEYNTSRDFHQHKENNNKLTKHENTTLKTFLGFPIDFLTRIAAKHSSDPVAIYWPRKLFIRSLISRI